jgi:hypothetical protein
MWVDREEKGYVVFVRVLMNWKAVEVFEIEESLKDLRVSKYDIHEASRIADTKKKLIEKRGVLTEVSVFQLTKQLIYQFHSLNSKQYQVFLKKRKIRGICKGILTSIIVVRGQGIGQESILILDSHWSYKLNCNNNNNNNNSNNSNNINIHPVK